MESLLMHDNSREISYMSKAMGGRVLVVALSALCGASWMLPLPWVGPALSLVFAGLVLAQKSWSSRTLVALAYYATGSFAMMHGFTMFLGEHAPAWEEAFFWMGTSALLAAGWIFVNRPWKAVLVLFFYALVPPLSFIDWLSPLTAAGAIFPGMGPFGFSLLAGIAMVPELSLWSKGHYWDGDLWEIASNFVLAALICNAAFALMAHSRFPELRPFRKPADWGGASWHAGSVMPDILAKKDARVVLLPDTLKTNWVDNIKQIQQEVPARQTWLVGVSALRKTGGATDFIVAFQHQGKPKVLFTSVFPLPISMQNLTRVSSWWEPARNIDGVRAWASIGHDQLLPWVWMEGVVQQPQVILVTHNGSLAKGSGMSTIQRNTALAWGRLMGDLEIELGNR